MTLDRPCRNAGPAPLPRLPLSFGARVVCRSCDQILATEHARYCAFSCCPPASSSMTCPPRSCCVSTSCSCTSNCAAAARRAMPSSSPRLLPRHARCYCLARSSLSSSRVCTSCNATQTPAHPRPPTFPSTFFKASSALPSLPPTKHTILLQTRRQHPARLARWFRLSRPDVGCPRQLQVQ